MPQNFKNVHNIKQVPKFILFSSLYKRIIYQWTITDMTTTACRYRDGVYLTAAPYLFPLVLEYSLIAVAVMAGIYHTLNTTHPTKVICEFSFNVHKTTFIHILYF